MNGQDREGRVEDLRQQLKTLGYLDAGVDRVLLASAGRTTGPVALALRAAPRVGLLGGALLGPCAALGLGARLPGLISGGRDAVVLATYLAILFFVAIAALSCVVSLLALALVRTRAAAFGTWARRGSIAAGLLVFVACLTYLTLWWRTANAGFGWSAPLWTTFALIIAVVISLLLGHAERITTMAVLTAAAGPSTPIARAGTRSWRLIVAGALIAFAGAGVLLLWTAPGEGPETDARTPLTVVSTGRRVRLIAIDGFDVDAYRLTEPGAGLPLLGHAYGRLQPQDTSDPARAWTTVATAQPPQVHGVHGIETRRVAGVQGTLPAAGGGTAGRLIRAGTDLLRLTKPAITTRDERRAKTLWEVAADAGLRTAVVNWWASWPAPPGSGMVITDRAVLRLERGGALDAEIAPADLYGVLRAAWPALRQHARDMAAQAFSLVADRDAATALRRSAELDATIIGIRQALPGPERDLDVIYLPGLDIAQHALLGAGEGGALAPSVLRSRVEDLGRYYRFLESALAGLIAARDGEIVMIVTQPGRVRSSGAGLLSIDAPGLPAEGGLTASVVDVMPTVLDALGVPISRELAGRPLTSLLGAEFEQKYPQRFVPTYGRPFITIAPRQGQPLDEEMIDRLRSLGYVK